MDKLQFLILIGVMSPVLFNILLEVVIAVALEGNEIGATISGNLISNLHFADDICLVATSNDDLQQLIDAVHTTSSRFGLTVSSSVAPSYLSQLVRVADLPGRRSLRSARTNRLLVPSITLSTVGGRAFPVAGPTIWNSLPDNVISAPSLSTFRQRLKTFLFPASFPDIIIDRR